ncbi:MAG: NUDIX hydrolase [Streptosporangiaceae bacterium]
MATAEGTTVRRNILAAAVVIHEDHVLLVRRSHREKFLPGAWGVPCGKLNQEEKPADAVLRELREETGLSGAVARFAGKTAFVSEWDDQLTENIQHNYLVRPLDLRVVLPDADQAYRWVKTSHLHEADLDAHNLLTISQALVRPLP